MSFTRWLRRLAPLMVCLVLLVTACSSAPSKYDQAQKDTTGFGSPAAVDKKAEKGGTFNAFFPGEQGGYKVIPYQEKKGFAEYKLEQDGKTLAMLTISDTTSVPASASKYSAATETVGGFPAVDQGTTATGVLVNDRYQVKVLSRDPSFTKEDRVAWLQKFDLKGLAQLKGAINSVTKPSVALPEAPTAATPAAPARPKDGFKLPRVKLPRLAPSLQPAS
ncbi:hypothetical protein IQ265_13120 [Nodosilinea sp. LEGE 06152]|uniref:hypothetical protein n=1 Tax=Nodosilinea sp. LEGE 06152 TaxID=2777966 RepID=UPI0018830FA3|nr:hypothetical protein [Nodosilinea sp. LEGE 06152]MBE9157757.1 hypothetical protein [Nodosilinea sp. LEGE 06152]